MLNVLKIKNKDQGQAPLGVSYLQMVLEQQCYKNKYILYDIRTWLFCYLKVVTNAWSSLKHSTFPPRAALCTVVSPKLSCTKKNI